MNCFIEGCSGHYEDKLINYPVHDGENYAVIEDVPAKVCHLCGDTIISSETMEGIEEILWQGGQKKEP